MAKLRLRFAGHALTRYLLPGDWLQRSFAVQDLRRSRASRIADGHVLGSCADYQTFCARRPIRSTLR